MSQINAIAPPVAPVVSTVDVNDSNATQTIAHATWTRVLFDTESLDAQALHSAGLITAVESGVYAVSASVTWDTNTTGGRGIRLLLNGSNAYARAHQAASPGGISMAVASVIPIVGGFTLEVQVYQDSGTARTIARDAGSTPKLSAVRVGHWA